MDDLVLVGGGEHARVVVDSARAAGVRVLGFLDPLPCEETARLLEVTRLGGDEQIAALLARATFIVAVGAIGVSPVRRDLVGRLSSLSPVPRWTRVVHPRATVAPSAHIGPGTLVMPGAVVGPGARVGAHVVINTGAIVEHDCLVSDFAQLGPGVVLGGGACVGEGAYLGLGSRVRDHASIGDDALVGMGAVVVGNVPPGACVVGIPARPFHA